MKFIKNTTLCMLVLSSVFQLDASFDIARFFGLSRQDEQTLKQTAAQVQEMTKESTAMAKGFYGTLLRMEHPSVATLHTCLLLNKQQEKAAELKQKDLSRCYRYSLCSAIAGATLFVMSPFFGYDKTTCLIAGASCLGVSYMLHKKFESDYKDEVKLYTTDLDCASPVESVNNYILKKRAEDRARKLAKFKLAFDKKS